MSIDQTKKLTIPGALEHLIEVTPTDSAALREIKATVSADVSYIRRFCDDLVSALYADRGTGELTGANTICEKSCADFVDAINCILDQYGLTPDLPDCPKIDPKCL